MLRTICFNNFIKFTDFQRLDFSDNEPSIFVGENGAGKSAVLEGIRRCLTLKLSTSLSHVPDVTQLSYFMCNFEEDDPEDNVICGIVAIPEDYEKMHNEVVTTTGTEQKDHEELNQDEETMFSNMFEEDTDTVFEEGADYTHEDGADYTHEDGTVTGSDDRSIEISKERTGGCFHWYKFIIKSSYDKDVHINQVKETKNNENILECLNLKVKQIEKIQEDVNNFKNEMKNKSEKGLSPEKKLEKNEKVINEFLKALFSQETIEDDYQGENMCERILKDLSNKVVFTFPLRAIGAVQWSESDKINNECKKDNYSDASKRCEILNRFLTSVKTEGNDDFDEIKEKEYFTDITQSDEFNFKLTDDGKIVVNDNKFALLKTPEGILEVKHFSILMSSNKYKTIILEEPGKGIHPQFIERMMLIMKQERKGNKRKINNTDAKIDSIAEKGAVTGDIGKSEGNESQMKKTMTERRSTEAITMEAGARRKDIEKDNDKSDNVTLQRKEAKGENKKAKERKVYKRIILTTHNPAFITPWSVAECFVFKRHTRNRHTRNRIISVKDVIGPKYHEEDHKMKQLRLLTSDHFEEILFAKRVLFVEGDSEMLFFSELKHQIVYNELKDTAILHELGDELKKKFFELTLIKMNGMAKANFCHEVCTKLMTEHIILVDRDAVEKSMLKQTDAKVHERNGDQVLIGDIPKRRWEEERKSKFKEQNLFFWVDGDIEDMLVEMFEHNNELMKPLNEQKLEITSETYGKGKKSKGEKLFQKENVTPRDIRICVKIIAEQCSKDDDLYQFLCLLKDGKHYNPNVRRRNRRRLNRTFDEYNYCSYMIAIAVAYIHCNYRSHLH